MAFPNRTEQFDNFYTTTYNNRSKTFVDQIFQASPYFRRMRKKGRLRLDGSGGRYIEFPLSYAQNETVTSIGRGDTVSISDTQFATVAQYTWKYVAGSLIRYYTDDQENKGKQSAMNLANSKIDNLRDSMIDEMEEMMAGDGTGNSNKDWEGLNNLVDATPTTARTVGNIPQTTYTWWQNKQKTSTGAASLYLVSDARTLFNNCSTGQKSKEPTLWVTTQTIHEFLEDEIDEKRQIIQRDQADPDMELTTLRGRPVIWNSHITSGYLYALNENYLAVVVDPDVNFTMTQWKWVPNSLDRVAQIVVKGNHLSNRRASLGVLTGVSA